jgi:hypothetical protein
MIKDRCKRGHSKLNPKNVTWQLVNGKWYPKCRRCNADANRIRYQRSSK